MQGMQPCSGTLQEIVAQGRPCYKARLLHYFTNPNCSKQAPGVQPAWCGWHTDHSSLTGVRASSLHAPVPSKAAVCYQGKSQMSHMHHHAQSLLPCPAMPCPALPRAAWGGLLAYTASVCGAL